MALVQLPRQFVVSLTGAPRVGAKAYFYQAGSSTPITTYTTASYAVAHANPVESVSNGFFPAIYVNPAENSTFKLVITDSADVTIWSEDNVPATDVSAAIVGQALYPRTDAEQSPTTGRHLPGGSFKRPSRRGCFSRPISGPWAGSRSA